MDLLVRTRVDGWMDCEVVWVAVSPHFAHWPRVVSTDRIRYPCVGQQPCKARECKLESKHVLGFDKGGGSTKFV